MDVPLSFYATFAAFVIAAGFWAAARSRLGHAAGWIALLLVGQACALQLIWAGPDIRLQMFRGWGELLRPPRAVFFAGVLMQAAVVCWAAWRRRRQWAPMIAKVVGVRGALLLIALVGYSSTTIAPEWARELAAGNLGGLAARSAVHASKVILAFVISGTALINLILAVTTLSPTALSKAHEYWARLSRRSLPLMAALAVVVASSLVSVLVWERVPHIPDEVCYIFQAKYFAEGQLWLTAPPTEDSFPVPFTLIENGRWYATTAAGWPAILAVGFVLGVPWLVNPLLGGATILLCHAFLKRLYEKSTADKASVLLACSPWFIIMSASWMPHPLTLALAVACLHGISRGREGLISGGLQAGLCCGALFHVRPLDAAVIALVGGVWWISAGWRKLKPLALAAALSSGAAMLLLLLGYNQRLTNDALLFPINHYFDLTYGPGVNRLGFGKNVGMHWPGLDALPGHGPIDVFMNTNQNMYHLDFDTFGWAAGSMLLVFLLLIWRRWRQDLLAWGLVIATGALMNLYWYAGPPDLGSRYWYVMVAPLAVLTVRGAEELSTRLANHSDGGEIRSRVWAALAIIAAAAIVTMIPWRGLDKYYRYRGVGPQMREFEREHKPSNALILVRGRQWPDYAEAFTMNPPLVHASPSGNIYALETSQESSVKLQKYFAGRSVWIVQAPENRYGKFSVIARAQQSPVARLD